MIKVAFFDVDGTLKAERDPYMFLHRLTGTERQGTINLNSFLGGEYDYAEFARRDAALWAGLPVSRVDDAFAGVPYIQPARNLANSLRNAGIPLMLISSGLDRHVRQVSHDLDAAGWIANELLVDDCCLTGKIRVHVGWDGKGDIVRRYMIRHELQREECLAVGDGTSDIGMFKEVGYRVAVDPQNATVRKAADKVLGEADVFAWLRELDPRIVPAANGVRPPSVRFMNQDPADLPAHGL